MNKSNRLTQVDTWEQCYRLRNTADELDFGWKNHTNLLIAGKIESLGLEKKVVLEIGAGDSAWLPYLARKYPDSSFTGIDYSETGCAKLAERLKVSGASAHICREDLFLPDRALLGKFDLVMSFGVVEHFLDLAEVLSAEKKFLNEKGLLFTLIPNMAGTIGRLTKMLNVEVFDRHYAHDWDSFRDGHVKAGLSILSGGYLGSCNYGVLSSCITQQQGFAWNLYVFLTRVTKMISWAETKLGDLPASKVFSPYIYAISRTVN